MHSEQEEADTNPWLAKIGALLNLKIGNLRWFTLQGSFDIEPYEKMQIIVFFSKKETRSNYNCTLDGPLQTFHIFVVGWGKNVKS